MPRSKKFRKVCGMPDCTHFGTLDKKDDNNKVIVLTVEEYEAIRLIDLEQMTQEQCAEQMVVARTTVQRIYNDARRKIAEYFVNGYVLKIQGGSYRICNESDNPNGNGNGCGMGCRNRNRRNQTNETSEK